MKHALVLATLALVATPLPLACTESSACSDCEAPEMKSEASVAHGSGLTRRDQRQACRFAAGALPKQTLARSEPQGSAIPIDHFIVVMQENRSFDHYFEMLPERGQPAADVAPKDFSNPDPDNDGVLVRIFPQTAYCLDDMHHGWNRIHKQYADGAMSGFVASANPNGARALGYYDERDLPYYYGLAKTFSIGDRYFSDVLGPTYPNRLFAHSASSFGLVSDEAPAADVETKTIYHQLEQAGVSWTIYSDRTTYEEALYPALRTEDGRHFAAMQRFFPDADSGRLPAFAWLEARTLASARGDDEHPPSDVQLGQSFVARVVEALMQSPVWKRSALFITYDEHGGFFDHVAPPPACIPDAVEPALSANQVPGRFDRYGIRVPLIVVSPFAKPHHVSHEILSHASLLRLLQARYGLPALSARDANATPPYDLFDFRKPSFLTPPALPRATIDPRELARCQAAYP